MQEDVYTIQEVATLLKCSVSTIRNMIYKGKLKTVRVGNRHRITETGLQEFLNGTPNSNDSTPTEPLEAIKPVSDTATDHTAEPTEDTTEAPPSRPQWDGISGKEENTEKAIEEHEEIVKDTQLERLVYSVDIAYIKSLQAHEAFSMSRTSESRQQWMQAHNNYVKALDELREYNAITADSWIPPRQSPIFSDKPTNTPEAPTSDSL